MEGGQRPEGDLPLTFRVQYFGQKGTILELLPEHVTRNMIDGTRPFLENKRTLDFSLADVFCFQKRHVHDFLECFSFRNRQRPPQVSGYVCASSPLHPLLPPLLTFCEQIFLNRYFLQKYPELS